MAAKPLVLVGVDGSEQSVKAACWAADYVEKFNGSLRVLAVWMYPAAYGYEIVDPNDHPEETARQNVEKTIAALHLASDQVTPALRPGPAARTLIEESAEADLLVVGSRGRGAFTGMLLGSVSTHCVHHAHCPVVVVH